MRVSASLWWDRHRGREQIGELVERGRAATEGNVLATTVKIMTDGVVENCSCALLEPYEDPGVYPAGHRGLSYIEHDDLRSAVVALDAQGFQVHMHAIGDRATRGALDAVEAARAANGPGDNRHHVAHLQFVHPDDVPRFGALGVIANMQPLWACMDPQMRELTTPRVGEERMGWQYPFGDLLRTGATLAGGSDWPVSTPNPLLEMEVAVTRVDPGARDQEPYLPEQRLTLGEAFTAFTVGSATVNHDDVDAGSIDVGKRADLAVLDRNVFGPDAGPLGDARVILTVAGGRVVHEAG
jgi:predicted amidohydrolase YtcJ